MQPPFQVQTEKRRQRLWVSEHYDFVYVCRAKGVKPQITSPLTPQWMSINELRTLKNKDEEFAPFPDIVPTYEAILEKIGAVLNPKCPL